MTPEEKSLLERTYKLAEENNEILRQMRRMNRFSTVIRFLYWAVIIISALGAYYFIQPYIDAISGLYGQAQDNIHTVQDISGKLGELLK